MSRKKIGILCALILVLIIGGAVYAAYSHSGEEISVQNVDGVYQRKVPTEEDTSIRIGFDAGTMTYVEDMIVGEQSFTLDSGSYNVEDGRLYTFSETDDERSLEYVLDGDYILAKAFLYQGDIPDKDSFEAVCTYKGNGADYEITFHEDGTYEEISRAGGAEADSTEQKLRTSGTYVRDGKLINRTDDAGDPAIGFYIYEGRIVNAYYELIRD